MEDEIECHFGEVSFGIDLNLISMRVFNGCAWSGESIDLYKHEAIKVRDALNKYIEALIYSEIEALNDTP